MNPSIAIAEQSERVPTPSRHPLTPTTAQPRAQPEAERPAPFLQPIWELNARCLGLLAECARKEPADTFPLLRHVRIPILGMTSEMRSRAARQSFLLLDMEFANSKWWRTLRQASRSRPLPPWQGQFPRAKARALARATLSATWHGLRGDRHARFRMGMAPEVAEVIEALSLTELERLAEKAYRFLRPRWVDRPEVWLHLLESAATGDYRRAREFNVRGLQLFLGELLRVSGVLTHETPG